MSKSFLALCYHYVRHNDDSDPFKRLLGTSENEFYEHLKMLSHHYEFISLDDVYNFLYTDKWTQKGKPGLLLTFDDGLSDHFNAAKILSEFNIKGVFFIPTCILKERQPANPTIIHYCIAKYGIVKFLEVYDKILIEKNIVEKTYKIRYNKEIDSIWDVIAKIKSIFKYRFSYQHTRSILLLIYQRLLLKEYPNVIDMMHLSEEQIKKMNIMGHNFGTHTHTHISLPAKKLTKEQQELELIEAKQILEKVTKEPIISFSHPYGETKDCLIPSQLVDLLKIYKLIFTVEQKNNVINTSPYSIGRYSPTSRDDIVTLRNKLSIIKKNIVD